MAALLGLSAVVEPKQQVSDTRCSNLHAALKGLSGGASGYNLTIWYFYII
jgi:hypothetical protein